MGEPAKAKAAPVKKTQQATAKKTPQQAGGLRLATWAPGPETDAGRPLDPHTLQAMESRFGHDFGRVRIHTGPEAHRSADGLGAHAYTLGLDVRFGEGRYRPDTPAGEKLLVHELEHVARAGPRGPAVPKLQPKDPVNHWENLASILRLPGNRDVKLRQYVEAHPDSFETAERILVNWRFKGQNEGNVKAVLLNVLAKLDPKSKGRVESLVLGGTGLLRQDVLRAHRSMWRSYETAAYAHAWLAWSEEQLKKKKLKPAEARLLQGLRKAAQIRFDVAAGDHESELRNANKTLDALMEASDAQPSLQLDVLQQASDFVHGAIGEARRERIHSNDDVATLKKYPSAQLELRKAEEAAIRTGKEEKEAQDRQTALEGPVGPKAAATPEIKEARKTARAAGTRRAQAKKALDLRSAELTEWVKAEHRLRDERSRRDAKIASTLPADVQEPGVKLSDFLDDDQKWWIYHTALNNLGTGFGYGPRRLFHESTTGNILRHRSKLATNRMALGVDYNVGVSTYERHGEGQYDIYSAAGKNVNTAVPEQVDLALVLGRPAGSTGPRLFQHVSSGVLSASPVDQNAADDSVLAKLIHGYFGFDSWDRKKREAWLKGERQGLPTPNPDPTRILGGLTFDKTISGQQPSGDVIGGLEAISKALEVSLHTRLRALTPPVDIKDDIKILDLVHADTGDFAAGNAISAAAYSAFYAVPGNRKYSRPTASAAVYAAVRKAVLEDAAVSGPLEKLIAGLQDEGFKGNRGGPAMMLTHKYREVNGKQEAWIQVYYGHMHDVEQMPQGAAVKQGDPLGKVGSSGNSVSPHVHMGIAVYEREPRYGVPPIGFLVPLDYFPFWGAKP